MFSTQLLDTLQVVAFPLEVLGFSLALIEVRFPRLAEAMVNGISRTVAKAVSRSASFEMQERDSVSLLKHARSRLIGKDGGTNYLSLVLPAYVLKVVWWAFLLWGLALLTVILGAMIFGVSPDLAKGVLQILLILAMPIAASGIICGLDMLAGALVYFTDRFVEGRAVGTLGLFIAGLGVLADGYQVAALALA